MHEGLPSSTATTRDAQAQVRALRTPSPPDALPLDDLLATLPTIAADAVQAELRLRERVALLRDRRATWAEIGAALGVTRQAAWERFGRRTSRAG
jgi:hypothetical protein